MKKIRMKLGKSQGEFAEMIRVPIATVRNWEQGLRTAPPSRCSYCDELIESVREGGRILRVPRFSP